MIRWRCREVLQILTRSSAGKNENNAKASFIALLSTGLVVLCWKMESFCNGVMDAMLMAVWMG